LLGSQEVPAPSVQAAGTDGQRHFAFGRLPLQESGVPHAIDEVVVRHPLLLVSQVSRFPFAAQTLPAIVHSAGGVGQLPQAAAPAVPVQATLQTFGDEATRQFWPSSEQVTTFPFPSQKVPAWPVLQTAGLVGQVQAAFGNAPPHGSLVGQVAEPVA
jgi:hypothetical protein